MLCKFTDLEKKTSTARPPYILLNSQPTCKLLVLGRLVLYVQLRACLHGGGGPQVGEVTRLAVVEKWPAFTCKLTTPESRGDFTRRCCVVARHVSRENKKWRANDPFWRRSVFFSSHYLLSLQHFSAVTFYCHFY